jgi:hypothetical protein
VYAVDAVYLMYDSNDRLKRLFNSMPRMTLMNVHACAAARRSEIAATDDNQSKERDTNHHRLPAAAAAATLVE